MAASFQNTYEAVEEDYEKRGYIGLVLEKGHRDQGILGKPCLAVDEGKDHAASDDKQSYDLCGVPWEEYPSEVESEKKHEGTSEEGEDAEPINGLHSIDERSVFMLDIQKYDDQNGC